MIYAVFDLEANGLLENVTKIHCICTHIVDTVAKTVVNTSLTDYPSMRQFLLNSEVLVGHNIIRYDIPVAEKVLGIRIKARKIDTLGVSWYLFPLRVIHGLEEWGKDFSIAKPPIVDWEGLPVADYVYRCSEDVRINVALFKLQKTYLKQLYGQDIDKLLNYLSFKLDCAREQEQIKWRLDREYCEGNLQRLSEEKEKKRVELAAVMPRIPRYKVKSKPKVMECKDGSTSKLGESWYELLHEQGLPEYHNGALKLLDHEEEGNPNAPQQVKDWLTSLGWIPETFNYIKEWEGSRQVQREIPQIMSSDGTGVCASIKKMFPEHPDLRHLEDYSVLKHRTGLLKGFLKDVNEEGFLKAEINGFTNTLRFQHKTIVNLPQMPKKYWEEIRGCLIAPSTDMELCGADMSALEDSTKQHYMYYFDPNYVKELRTPGFDPHLDIALLAGMLTKEQVEEHKLYDKTEGVQGKSHKAVRLKAKKVNFTSMYGAGTAKIAVTASIPTSEASLLRRTYWERNKALKQVEAACEVKIVNGQMWLRNPVSDLWYSLRAMKDRFSTLNQGTGAYCFDRWVSYTRRKGVRMCGQFHDEMIFPTGKGRGYREAMTAELQAAIRQTNDELRLNVPLKISIQFGDRYSDIH